MATPGTVGQEFEQELTQTGDQVTQGAVQATQDLQNLPGDLQHKIEALLQTAKNALTNFSGGVSGEAAGFLLQNYMWASMCLIGFLLGEMAGKNAFYSVTEGIFGSWSSIMIHCVVVPLVVWGCGKLFVEYGSDQLVLVGSALLGMLTWSAMHGRRLHYMAPPPCVLPLSVALASYAAGSSPVLMNDRHVFVPVMIAPAVFAYILFGMHQMCTSYVIYAALLTAVAVIDLQVKLDALGGSLQLHRWNTIVALGMADVVVFWIMSESY